MAAKNSKGVTVCVSKAGVTPGAIVPTAIAKSATAGDNRAHITVAAAVAGLKVGDLIKIPTGGTGFKEIDGKTWTVGSIDTGGTGFTLNGTNLSATTGTLAATPTMQHYADTDMVCLCLSQLQFNAEKGSTISVATYCDPSASIPSASTTAGTVDLGGYVDVTTADYKELLAAEDDGVERIYRIMLPQNGEIVFPGIISSFGWDLPLDGAVAWNASLALGSRPRHLF